MREFAYEQCQHWERIDGRQQCTDEQVEELQTELTRLRQVLFRCTADEAPVKRETAAGASTEMSAQMLLGFNSLQPGALSFIPNAMTTAIGNPGRSGFGVGEIRAKRCGVTGIGEWCEVVGVGGRGGGATNGNNKSRAVIHRPVQKLMPYDGRRESYVSGNKPPRIRSYATEQSVG